MATRSSPDNRPATRADLPGIEGVLGAIGDATPPEEGRYPAFLDLLLDHGRLLVATLDGQVVAFAGTMTAGARVHLSDLFVRPADQGRGIGRALLEAALGERWPRTTFSSDDPRALPLYVRAGMAPGWPNLYLEGDAARLAPPHGFEVVPASPAEAAALESALTGVERRDVYEFAATRPQPKPFLVMDRGRPVATGVSHARLAVHGRWIDRAVASPETDAGRALLAGIVAEAPGGPVGMCVPGPSPLLPVLLQAGFRIVDRDTFMASEAGLVDPLRTLVDPETA
jgi:GNAT superfamily N-acetyltransferase